ncbi:required for drug-induced death protein 1 [Eublepharis macularius]|uniref:Required for drug-induced death protein 1 n=1 Tax=Eublepharis macularius TaxID=481883 RepID=A0AA97JFA3_EUBMA|nr:required for drug-induced death protein 1 [Eublepharis macularius]
MTVGAKAGGTTLRARGRRLGPAEDQIAILGAEAEEEEEREKRAPEGPAEEGPGCSSKQVAFALLPDKYEPFGADGEQRAPAGERKSQKRRRKLRKYGKNVGKVLQKGCRYVVLGLQGLANAYSSPFGVAVSVATLFR